MTTPALRTNGNRPHASLVTLGAGWMWPAVLVAFFVSFLYLPAHAADTGAVDGLIATIAALYVVAVSVGLVRLVRGGVLRVAGSGDPIVLFGRGPEPMLDVSIRARWRLAAIGAGGLVAAAGVVGAGLLTGTTGPGTYPHALASLDLGVNLALVGGVLVPAPGFTGWALILAVVDAGGAGLDQRVRRAARLAQLTGVPIFLSLGLAAAALGDPMVMLVGFLVAMFIGTQTSMAVGHDAIARFLRGRVLGDLARPVAGHADADEPVEALMTRLPGSTAVTAVEAGGALIGALGPRQLAARDRDRAGQRVSEIMVALGDVALLPAATPAIDVIAAIGRHGFALVRGAAGLAYIEANDLLGQIQAGAAGSGDTAGGREVPVSGPVDERPSPRHHEG